MIVRLVLVGLCLFWAASASTAGADCRSGRPLGRGWPRNSIVYYNLDRLPKNVREQARRAFDEWTSASDLQGLGVRFREGRGPLQVDVRKGWVRGSPAETRFSLNRRRETIGTAIIVIDLDDREHFDPRTAGYDTVVLKTVLHEVGHTMGLSDSRSDPCDEAADASVMNGQCNANDAFDAQPDHVAACDVKVLRDIQRRR
ncbi:MAG: hypothetical protein U0Q12_04190 [Vicinamibacterales bacterium]